MLIPCSPGRSFASNIKYPQNPRCSAPESIIVSRARVAMCTLLPLPRLALARISSMAHSSPPARQAPRISANDLALFMVSSDTARLGIVRRSKFPQKPPIIRYRDVRTPVCNYLADRLRSVNPLVQAEAMFRQRANDPSMSSLRQDDARQCIEVLRAIQGMGNQLGAFDFHSAPPSQPALDLAGVEVSIRADLLVYGSSRGKDQIGAAVLRLTQSDADTDAARSRRQDMGHYVATLARMHLDANIPSSREPTNRLCLSIDVQHGEAFPCPASNTRRRNDLESACRFIAALWPGA